MIKRILAFENPAYLKLRNQQMVIEIPEVVYGKGVPDNLRQEGVRTVPIEDIGVVILDNKQITITQALMSALLENNCAIITTNDQHLPIGLYMPLDGNHLQNERFREQLDASEPLRKQMWQQTITSKILGQAAILEEQGIENKNMLTWAKSVRSGDVENMEGRAAAYYWRNVFHNPDFVRGQEGAPPNNLLNYGYTIVRAMVARALVGAGLLPTLGIHHHNRYNAYCLADDIMEPYRPFVDQLVIKMIRKYEDITNITTEMKRDLLGLAYQDVIIDGKRSPMQIATITTAKSVYKCFSGEARKIIYPDW